MHGFHQGIETVKDLIVSPHPPDVISLQEHWLTPANMYLFDESTDYCAFYVRQLC